MKKVLFFITMMFVLSVTALAQTATINKTWYEYDVKLDDGSKGYRFHTSFDVTGKQYGNIRVFVWFSKDGYYWKAPYSAPYKNKSSDGYAIVYKDGTPSYQSATYSDFKLTIPYSALGFKRGETYKYWIEVRDKDNNKTLATSSYYTLTEWQSSPSGEFESVTFTPNVEKDGKKGFYVNYDVSISADLGESYEIGLQLYDKNQENIPCLYSSYSSKQGNFLAMKKNYTPSWMSSLWENQKIFVPYEALTDVVQTLSMVGNQICYYYLFIRKMGESNSFAWTDYKLFYQNTVIPKETYNHPVTTTYEKASITWLSSTDPQKQKSYIVKAGVKSTSQIDDWSVSVNGQTYRGFQAVSNDGYDLVINKDVLLSEGNNVVTITVTNKGGTSTYTSYVTCNPETFVVNTPSSQTQRRLALVIGNSNYSNAPLKNPVNDATDVASKLKSLGFEVMLVTDGGKKLLDQKINEFGNKASSYDVCMFYYAGHGIQYNGDNYLVPVDVANLASQSDIPYDCINAGRVLGKMEESNSKTNIVVLDACRNNPLAPTRDLSGGGLSSMNAPRGSIIVYSTAPGSVAIDGQGRNSPFTSAFLKELDEPKVEILNFFKHISKSVGESTSNAQTPWVGSSLADDFYFRP